MGGFVRAGKSERGSWGRMGESWEKRGGRAKSHERVWGEILVNFDLEISQIRAGLQTKPYATP
jgi:hypothetical protein